MPRPSVAIMVAHLLREENPKQRSNNGLVGSNAANFSDDELIQAHLLIPRPLIKL